MGRAGENLWLSGDSPEKGSETVALPFIFYYKQT
jgi:hypothetical protein